MTVENTVHNKFVFTEEVQIVLDNQDYTPNYNITHNTILKEMNKYLHKGAQENYKNFMRFYNRFLSRKRDIQILKSTNDDRLIQSLQNIQSLHRKKLSKKRRHSL